MSSPLSDNQGRQIPPERESLPNGKTGIGVYLQGTTVAGLLPASPASAGGLVKGDKIFKVDGESVDTKSVSGALCGSEGSVAVVEVRRSKSQSPSPDKSAGPLGALQTLWDDSTISYENVVLRIPRSPLTPPPGDVGVAHGRAALQESGGIFSASCPTLPVSSVAAQPEDPSPGSPKWRRCSPTRDASGQAQVENRSSDFPAPCKIAPAVEEFSASPPKSNTNERDAFVIRSSLEQRNQSPQVSLSSAPRVRRSNAALAPASKEIAARSKQVRFTQALDGDPGRHATAASEDGDDTLIAASEGRVSEVPEKAQQIINDLQNHLHQLEEAARKYSKSSLLGIALEKGTCKVVNVVLRSPASRPLHGSPVEKGDELLAVNGVPYVPGTSRSTMSSLMDRSSVASNVGDGGSGAEALGAQGDERGSLGASLSARADKEGRLTLQLKRARGGVEEVICHLHKTLIETAADEIFVVLEDARRAGASAPFVSKIQKVCNLQDCFLRNTLLLCPTPPPPRLQANASCPLCSVFARTHTARTHTHF